MLWGVKMPQHRSQTVWPGLAGRGGSRGVAEVAGTVIRAANIALFRSIDPELKRGKRKSTAQRPSLFRNPYIYSDDAVGGQDVAGSVIRARDPFFFQE